MISQEGGEMSRGHWRLGDVGGSRRRRTARDKRPPVLVARFSEERRALAAVR